MSGSLKRNEWIATAANACHLRWCVVEGDHERGCQGPKDSDISIATRMVDAVLSDRKRAPVAITIEFWEEIEKIAAAANREAAIRVFDAVDGSEHPFLSNFSTSPFVVKRWGEEFVPRTVEHAYQAMKTDDRDEFEAIINAARPGVAKRFGRAVKDLRPDWETYKFEVMLLCLRRKFENVVLRSNLIGTGDALLVEGNTWHDNIWGDCHCGKRDACQEPGKNYLGKFLMKVRQDLS